MWYFSGISCSTVGKKYILEPHKLKIDVWQMQKGVFGPYMPLFLIFTIIVFIISYNFAPIFQISLICIFILCDVSAK